jgi:replication factor C subunit 3/5
LANCIPNDVILKQLMFDIVASVDSTLKGDIICVAAEYEHRMRLGNKAIFHMEACVAQVMSIYAKYLLEI